MKKLFIPILISLFVITSPLRVLAVNTYSAEMDTDLNQFQSISDATQSGMDINSDFTMEAWINLTSFPSGTFRGVMGKYDNGSRRQYAMYFYNNSGSKTMYCVVSTNGSSWQTVGSQVLTITNGSWYHMVCAYDKSTGDVELFWGTDSGDDVSQGVKTGSATSIANTTSAFEIGRVSGSTSFSMDGKIDEARLWNDIRTLTEINDNKYTELVGDETNLISYYREEQNGDDSDATSGNDLTDNNGVTYTTDVPFGGAAPAAILRKKGNTPDFGIY